MEFDAIKALIADDFAAVDELMLHCLQSKASIINDLGHHIIRSGGKRLRPMVVLLLAHACGYTGKNHIPIACIIELIHTATLLHDDVVDNAEQRRGVKTANTVFGNEAAVLVGDFLYSRAFQLMTKYATPPMIQILADTSNIMAEGESLQLMDKYNTQAEEGRYLTIIQAKTAKLFEAAALLAAHLGNTTEEQQKSVARFGFHLGTAFQLMDDVLDYQADPTKTGKKLGNDLMEGKVTLPLIYILNNGTESEARFLREAIERGQPDHFPKIQQLIETSGALKYTKELAKFEAEHAEKELQILPESKYREAARSLAKYAVDRAK
jgi:octaprenyl-diphosphate synthase